MEEIISENLNVEVFLEYIVSSDYVKNIYSKDSNLRDP